VSVARIDMAAFDALDTGIRDELEGE